MKRIAIILALALALALLPIAQVALAAAPVKRAAAKDAPAVGETVELEGRLKIYKKTKTAPAYAILTLDEPIVIKTVAGESEPQRELEVRPVPAKKLGGKQVRVKGPLVERNDANALARPFGINPAAATAIPNAKSVAMSKKTATMKLGEELTLSATVKPQAARQDVTWTSNKQSVATVVGGKVTAVGYGKAVITAKAANGKKATCTVTVPVPVTGVSVSPDSLTLKKGQSKQFKATVEPSNAANKKVKWESSNPSVATVSAKGLVKAKAIGTSFIQVTTEDGGFVAGCLVIVGGPDTPIGIWLDSHEAFLRPGETDLLVARVEPETATMPALDWKSSNSAVVTVDAKGLVTARGAGLATVYAETGLKDPFGDPIMLRAAFYVTATPPGYLDDAEEEDFVATIDGKRIELGMTLAQVKTLMPGGTEEPQAYGNLMYYTDSYGFGFNPKRQLNYIFIQDGAPFKTHRGIGTGNMLPDLLDKYGAPFYFESYHNEEDDKVWTYVLRYLIYPGDESGETRDLSFEIDPSQRVSFIDYWRDI